MPGHGISERRRSTGHRMAEWLELHDLDATRVRTILARAQRLGLGAASSRRAARASLQPNPMPALRAWAVSANALARRCPPVSRAAERTHIQARTNFAPDEARFPRAFTLHDDGSGHPYVSCPYHGTVGDLMAVAHEFGHAVQLSASRGVQLPPVLREVCAFFSELALLAALQVDDPRCFAPALRVWQADTHKQFTGDLARLETALLDETTPYSYQWNYPVARILAMEANKGLGPEEVGLLFGGRLKTPNVCLLLGI
jgi:hypothetical protein